MSQWQETKGGRFCPDGREWFEPKNEELVQYKQVRHSWFRRERAWKRTGGISGVFGEWGPWEFDYNEFPPAPGVEIPF